MKRKVIKLASNTLVVSLPSAWVKKTALSKGDEVDIDGSGDMLLIAPKGKSVSKSFTIDVDRMGFSKNMLSYLYQKGYDEVEIINLDTAVFKDAKDRVSDLMGFEIVEHSERRCVIKAVSKEMDSEFGIILRRTFLITLEMAKHLSEAISKNECSRVKEIRGLEKTTNTFTDFCKRVLSKGSYNDPENTVYMYIIVRDIEKIADCYKKICDVLIEKKSCSISAKTFDMIKRSNSFFELFYRLFYRFDPETFAKFKIEGKKLLKAADDLLGRSSHKEARIISELKSIITMTYDLIGPYFILNFERMG